MGNSAMRRRMFHLAYAGMAVGGLVLAGCGSSSSPPNTAQSAATPAAATTASVATAPPPTLRLLAPTRGAHTGTTVTVAVHLTGRAPGGSHVYRYLLDGRESRLGSTHLTFDELAPGPHHLVVTLAHDAGVRAGSFFVVRDPTPVASAQPAPVMTTPTATSPSASTSTEPTRSQPTATPSAPQPSSAGIPQGNGGDGDEDNNGGPSDGDGNV